MFAVMLIWMGIIVFEKVTFGNTQDFAVRLINSFGNNSREGRLEILYSGTWGTVCDDEFTNVSARVACASLGFGNIGTMIGNIHEGGANPIWLSEVKCAGVELNILQCSHGAWGDHICDHDEDVSIRCEVQNFAVRLNNSAVSNQREGRLEIYYSGRWGTVCDNGFTSASARVVCASLGFGYIGSVIDNRRGDEADPIWLDNAKCTGTETGIEQCFHDGWGVHNCSHDEDVSIACDCGIANFTEPTGTISSPNFPMEYENDLDCNNYIAVPFGQTLVITFLALRSEDNQDYITITCESQNVFRSPRFSGKLIPPVLTISSCDLVNVYFHTDRSLTYEGFKLTYNITSENVIGGLTTKPSNAIARSDPVVFNCTTKTGFHPWWTMNINRLLNYTITHSTCRVTISASYYYYKSHWFRTESLGPGSCNLIVVAPADDLHRLAGSFVCMDSTLASARAILAPINLQLNLTNSLTTVEDIIRDEEVNISCDPYFSDQFSNSSVVFTYFEYREGPVAQIRILKTYWTSEGNVVSSTHISNTSSYVLVKASVGVIPPYTCNIVCDYFSNISDMDANSSIEISFSSETMEVLFWPTKESMTISGDNNGQIKTPALLTCYADANPPATYTWTDETSGIVTKGPTIIVHHSGRYSCNASNIIREQLYQQSKSISVQTIEDIHVAQQSPTVLVLLGAAVFVIIIILVILLIRHQRRNTAADVGHVKPGSEYELRNRGGDRNIYEVGLRNRIESDDSGYDKLNSSKRRLPSVTSIYDEIQDPVNEDELKQSGECNIYDTAFGDDIDADESGYECPNASQSVFPNIVSVSCDELEFYK